MVYALLGLASMMFAASGVPATAQPLELLGGKSIDLVIGSAPSGGYNAYARVVARNLGRHIPGNPNIVPKNMPGAGSSTAAAYIFNIAPKDGNVLGAVQPAAIMEPLYEPKLKARYDPQKFNFLGSPNSGTRVCATFNTSQTKTFEDALRRTTLIGGAGGSTQDHPAFLNALLGAKFKIVTGYQSTGEVMLAMERGEVEGLCGLDYSSFATARPEWMRDKRVNFLVQVGFASVPELDAIDVPMLSSFVRDQETTDVVELIVGEQIFHRPYIAPPGVPQERVAVLRNAFDLMFKDDQFLRDAQQASLQILPTGGEEIQRLVNKMFYTSEPIVERAWNALGR